MYFTGQESSGITVYNFHRYGSLPKLLEAIRSWENGMSLSVRSMMVPAFMASRDAFGLFWCLAQFKEHWSPRYVHGPKVKCTFVLLLCRHREWLLQVKWCCESQVLHQSSDQKMHLVCLNHIVLLILCIICQPLYIVYGVAIYLGKQDKFLLKRLFGLSSSQQSEL